MDKANIRKNEGLNDGKWLKGTTKGKEWGLEGRKRGNMENKGLANGETKGCFSGK